MARCFIFQADAQKISTQDDCTVPTFKRKKKNLPASQLLNHTSWQMSVRYVVSCKVFVVSLRDFVLRKHFTNYLPKNKIGWKTWWICAHFVKTVQEIYQVLLCREKMSVNSDLCLLSNWKREIIFISSGARFSGMNEVHRDRPTGHAHGQSSTQSKQQQQFTGREFDLLDGLRKYNSPFS